MKCLGHKRHVHARVAERQILELAALPDDIAHATPSGEVAGRRPGRLPSGGTAACGPCAMGR